MNIEELRLYFLSKPATTESFPFDEHTLVFKVLNKMYGLIALDISPAVTNLKCDPEKAIALREEYDCVNPGYHMNKKHWNTVTLDGSVSNDLVKQWVDHSFELVVKGLTKKQKEELKAYE